MWGHMRWSFEIARIAGTGVKIHLTFLLFLVWIAFRYAHLGGPWAAAEGVLFVCLIFLCVLLHEFGHSLAARRYGIGTPEITLLPIGGVARLERMPEKPIEELCVALAGPAVNVVLAVALWVFIWVTGGFPDPGSIQSGGVDLPVKLLGVNIWLVLFNLIPAFPMDGGRVLRALLAMRTDFTRATQWAGTVGQLIAFGFGFLGLIGNPMLLLIAVFVYFGASSEMNHAQMRSLSRDLRVSSAMVTQFQALGPEATLNDAVELLLTTSQHEFPVLSSSGELAGILMRDDLIVALRQSGPQTLVSEVMRVNVPSVQCTMLFEQAFAFMQESHCQALPVLDNEGHLLGLFTPENVGEMMMVQNALANAPRATVRT